VITLALQARDAAPAASLHERQRSFEPYSAQAGSTRGQVNAVAVVLEEAPSSVYRPSGTRRIAPVSSAHARAASSSPTAPAAPARALTSQPSQMAPTMGSSTAAAASTARSVTDTDFYRFSSLFFQLFLLVTFSYRLSRGLAASQLSVDATFTALAVATLSCVPAYHWILVRAALFGILGMQQRVDVVGMAPVTAVVRLVGVFAVLRTLGIWLLFLPLLAAPASRDFHAAITASYYAVDATFYLLMLMTFQHYSPFIRAMFSDSLATIEQSSTPLEKKRIMSVFTASMVGNIDAGKRAYPAFVALQLLLVCFPFIRYRGAWTFPLQLTLIAAVNLVMTKNVNAASLNMAATQSLAAAAERVNSEGLQEPKTALGSRGAAGSGSLVVAVDDGVPASPGRPRAASSRPAASPLTPILRSQTGDTAFTARSATDEP
jgi:hypothetical protein